MSFSEILSCTLSHDQQIREQATKALESAENENYEQYIVSLVQELTNEESQSPVRSAAGLAIKNSLVAKDLALQEQFANRWMSVNPDIRNSIKKGLMQTLASADVSASTASAQAISAVAMIELPRNEWQDAISELMTYVTSPDDRLKIASLRTIGFICEGIDPEILLSQSNKILTAVIQGARSDEPNQEVRLTALQALYNSLEFARENFENEIERSVIMQTVCEATQSPNEYVQVVAFECLVRIMQLYYDKMQLYMEQALFELTVLGMKHENEKIALQAVEFWSTVCDEEIDLAIEAEECLDRNEEMNRINFQFAQRALSQVLPVLLYLLTKQDEDADEDEWNVSMASATALSLFAQATGDSIMPLVIPFVEGNIRSGDWRMREAAVMAFGSILEGPEPSALSPLVSQALPVLIEMVSDPVLQVKDSAAWTLGRVCDLQIDCIKLDVHLNVMISALVMGLKDSPRVVSNCCWALMNLSEQLNTPGAETNPLSPYVEHIIAALMQITESNTNEGNSRASAYEAMATIISTSAKDSFPIVARLGVATLDRLEATINALSQSVGSDDRMALFDLQSNLLSVITNVIRVLGPSFAEISDRCMTILLQLITSSGKQSSVAEDTFLAIGALISAIEQDFARYLEPFAPFLYAALQNFEEYQLNAIAVGIIGDICRAFGDDILPFCDQFMSILLTNIESDLLNRDVKPAILSCFGDISLAIGPHFSKYLEVVLRVLASACNMSASIVTDDYDLIDYNNKLRCGIFEAYVGIVQGLKGLQVLNLLVSQLPGIFGFMELVFKDPNCDSEVTRNMIGLIGDLAESITPASIKNFLTSEWISVLIRQGRSAPKGSSLREVSRWAKEMVKRATA
ncbi:Importin subunit beta-1 [Smittium mucronatum]|uniref:Importin-95 n=1 Tax=Smittium mucronatum TaxID=133383 RepID=A0A1R0H730_9FUNG|nr:Importin subunit beta-1 [Smittium mucronatum]